MHYDGVPRPFRPGCVTAGSWVYKGAPFPNLPSFLHISFTPVSYTSLPITRDGRAMSSHSNPITIAGDEEVPRLELGNSRLRRVPRRDYSYPDFESIVFGDSTADSTQSRKRKRTKTEESSSAIVRDPYKAFFVLC